MTSTYKVSVVINLPETRMYLDHVSIIIDDEMDWREDEDRVYSYSRRISRWSST